MVDIDTEAMHAEEQEGIIQKVRSRFGFHVPESVVRKALSDSNNDPDAAVTFLNDNPGFLARPVTVVRAATSTRGSRVLAPVKQEPLDDYEMVDSIDELNPKKKVKMEVDIGFEKPDSAKQDGVSSGSVCDMNPSSNGKMSFDDFLKATGVKVASVDEGLTSLIKQEPSPLNEEFELKPKLHAVKEEADNKAGSVTEEVDVKVHSVKLEADVKVECMKGEAGVNDDTAKRECDDSDCIEIKVPNGSEGQPIKVGPWPFFQKTSRVKKETAEEKILNVEDGDFPEDPDWCLVGGKVVIALSTTRGRKLVDNEIVYFSFPPPTSKYNAKWIVRISTKRSGEIGRLQMELAKCLIPLVYSSKIMVRGRCVAAPPTMQMMQEIMLYVSFYISHSIFTECDYRNSWRLDCTDIDSTIYPLLTLFRLLEINPFQKAEFAPEELDSRKRMLRLEGNSDEGSSALHMMKLRKGIPQHPEQNGDDQAISESSLNKLVGAAKVYDLKELDPPRTLMCDLRPYQKQALYWMSELEKGIDVENAARTLHPCWSAYRICEGRTIYINNFSGEATTQFPTATQMARGGILGDAMGLGKTVMTIALILARPGRGNSENKNAESEGNSGIGTKRKYSHVNTSRAKGGTLIVCPMALLGQWKDELENHSEPESMSIFVHYGGGRTDDSEVISEHDVVLTTYGLLQAAYKSDGENSIYHRINWYRVVLDEAHTIKAYKTQAAQAAFSLSSHCRWCLTGTPIQNSLEDLYSLLCFLHVEPWCNWAWWNKLVQRPYENGDPRGLRLVKAILRPLMLRRTKETKDKEGRPILVLPPTDIQVIECEQSEAEHDFYNALFKRSKIQFDQYVAEGKVLHNYANILELLLRLRQCCNHPYLVLSRSGSQKKHIDVDKLARRFLEFSSDSASAKQNVPSRAYVEEVVKSIQNGENVECPICMESADDPVLTPCAHGMCRECLLTSWGTPEAGPCPLCRQIVNKIDLIACPCENRFRFDIEENWKDSSKVSRLLECLECIRQSGSGEKSIIFSQWTSFLDLLEKPLKKKGFGYLRFDGKLAQKQRERILREFKESREKMVLLMSLKAGGVGLNLTAASNVFLMDPWWNPAVEEQAIMRIHRIGQKRTVNVRRFIVKDTVEERMQQVQAKKQKMISGALTDAEVRSARIEELKMLFR